MRPTVSLRTRNPRRALALITTSFLVSSFTPAHAGINKYYVGPGGLWQNGPWSTTPNGPSNTTTPVAGDSAFLNSSVGYTVSTNVSTSILSLGAIQLDGTGSGIVGLDNSAGVNISSTNLFVGATGQASLTCGGGSVSVGTIVAGANAGSAGSLTLGNTSLSISSSMTVGSSGFGQLDLSSGSIGTTTNAVPVNVGYSNVGVMNINGGSVGIGQLIGGVTTGGTGIISLNGGTLAVLSATRLGDPIGDSIGYLFLNGGNTILDGSVTVNRGSAIYAGGTNFIQSATGSFIVDGGTVDLGITPYFVNSSTGVTLTDGFFSAGTISSAGGTSINFQSGTVAMNNADFNPALNFVFGTGSINLTAGKALLISGRTTLGPTTPIVINGGTFSTGTLVASGADFQFDSGTFRLTGDTLRFGSDGIFGASYTLDGNHRLEVGNGNEAQIESGAQLYVTGGALMADGGIENEGLVQMASPVAQVGGSLFNNFGLLSGTGRILAPLLNQIGAEVRVNSGDTLRFESSGNSNGGLLNLNSGYLDFTQDLTNGPSGKITGRGSLSTTNLINQGSIQLSAGLTDIHGTLDNQAAAKVIVSGAATATFYDDVTNETGSEFRVSTGSTAVFFGTVTGLSEFTGPGLKDFEGDTLPGAIVSGGATLVGPDANVVAQSVRENSLSVEGNLSIVPNGTSTGVSRVSSLDIPGGKVDLANNALIVDYSSASPISTIRSLIISGRAGGSWTGPGITSSQANAGSFGVGYAEASAINTNSFLGQSVDNTTVLVRFTCYGDGNLDGIVNASDFVAMSMHFDKTGAFWSDGDFNYDGIVNALDFNYLASNFGQSLSSPALASLVPEPLVLTPAAIALMLFTRRRRARESIDHGL